MKKETFIYLPNNILEKTKNFIDYAAKLDGGEYKYHLIPVNPGDEYALNNNISVSIVECRHRIPTVGYLFYEKRKKLKLEYENLSGQELAGLKQKGLAVTEERDFPLFTFLGDTTTAVFTEYPALLSMPVIVTECTFLYEEHLQNAEETYHTHWEPLKKIIIENPKTIFVLTHFSLRYSISDIKTFFESQNTFKNVVVWMDIQK